MTKGALNSNAPQSSLLIEEPIAWSGIPTLATKAQLASGEGLIDLDDEDDLLDFIEAARTSRFWERESETPGVV
jgi:hypothetical protein